MTVPAVIIIVAYFVHTTLPLMQGRYQPYVEQINHDEHLTLEESIDMKSFDFMMAFSVHNALDRRIKYDDPSKVNWFVQVIDNNGYEDVRT